VRRTRPGPGRLPWYWPLLRTTVDALDHVTAIHHAEGNRVPGWIASGVLLGIVVWTWLRSRARVARALSQALAIGLLLTALRGGYALARRAYLVGLYAQWMRTMDEGFEIVPWFLIQTFWMAAGGAWLHLNARSRWGRRLSLLAILFPTWFMAAFWLGSVALINVWAGQRYGLPLYRYGGGLMALIACSVESIPIVLALWGAQRLLPRLNI
jgi:hypothetical protein